MKNCTILLAFILVLLTVGCSTVTISPKGKTVVFNTPPTVEERKTFYFWGLVGEREVDVLKKCSGKEPNQIQTQDTFLDNLFAVLTLGIYSPRTVKIWCSK